MRKGEGMKQATILLLAILFSFGCARISVEAPKEPIKVDISMRLDVYQHIQKDIDSIEDIVSGSKKEELKPDSQSLLDYLISPVYAEEGLSPEVKAAALRRRDRLPNIESLERKGIIGEDRLGLLKIKSKSDSPVENIINLENTDRMIIYRSLAQKNNTSLEEIQKIYSARLQKDAPSGTPIEVYDSSTGAYVWKIK